MPIYAMPITLIGINEEKKKGIAKEVICLRCQLAVQSVRSQAMLMKEKREK